MPEISTFRESHMPIARKWAPNAKFSMPENGQNGPFRDRTLVRIRGGVLSDPIIFPFTSIIAGATRPQIRMNNEA